jgi:hypothetical protein
MPVLTVTRREIDSHRRGIHCAVRRELVNVVRL